MLENLNVKIFVDSSNIGDMCCYAEQPWVKGFTTNPTLMRKAGVTDYGDFAKTVLANIKDKPISFEVVSDDLDEMERQARIIAEWGPNVVVKIPITTTKGEPTCMMFRKLARSGVSVNVTACLTVAHIMEAGYFLQDGVKGQYVSLFAGRVADTGVDPVPMVQKAVRVMRWYGERGELIWASPREVLNIFQANLVGCHIITVTPTILAKLEMVGRSLDEVSLATVKMFYDDAQKAGYKL